MIDDFVKEIKKKKSLKGLDDSFVEKLVVSYLNSNKKVKEKLMGHPKPLKSKEFKSLLKEIRGKLHEVYGVFDLGVKDLKRFDGSADWHKRILKRHKSTYERVDDYEFIYDEIFRRVGKAGSVLDLGCGLNPLSYRFINRKLKFYCCDVSQKDVDFLNEYFKVSGISGKAFACDLTEIRSLPKSDICFVFKLLDSLESLKKGVTSELFGKLKCKYAVVSFSTQSIGGRKKIPERKWFVGFLKDYSYEVFETLNEKFYVVKL